MDVGILLLRMTVGLALAAHGSQKVFGWFGGYGPDATGQFMETLGFRPGRRHALTAGFVELVGGLLLALGFLTPLAAALIASVMVVAVMTVHWKNGFFIPSGGYEFNLVLGVAALCIAFTGPGALSVDSVAGYARSGIGWGVSAAAIAAVGAIGQLAQRRIP
ncbi:MAG TPA: DoxX family protein [Vicinamibacterales bacterium]|jgi:putative oxidoreductase